MDTNELWFRCTTVAVQVGFGVVRGHFSKRVAREPVATGRAQARDRMYYRLTAALYFVPFVYALTPWLDFAHVRLPAGVRWTGALLAFAGVALVWWTHRSLGRHWSGILELRENHRLISSGPYRHIRHPMYTAFFMMPIGLALLTANLLVAVLQISAFTATYLARVADEEAMMLDRFGDEYRVYMRRTGRLFPRLRRGPGVSRPGTESGQSGRVLDTSSTRGEDFLGNQERTR
jgi:protein-S-isoprenylcysteine O-methyltransferase Ste14